MNKYLVVRKSGEIVEPELFRKSSECSENFRQFIVKEIFVNLPKDNQIPEKSGYLAIAKKFGFSWESNSDIGFLSYDYKANLIMRLVKEYARKLVNDIGFPIYEIKGANIFDLSHPVVEVYAKLYGDRLFQFKSGKKDVVMSYDASYPQFNLASQYRLNQNNLPFAHFSISDCYRYEQSGECMLLYRQRRFYMPDLHPYFKDINQAFEWYPAIEKQLVKAVKDINREYEIIIDVSSKQNWEQYQEKIINIVRNLNKDILINILDDDKDRYWIINADYKIIDKLGQSREICCIQIDIENAKRLGINYLDKKGVKRNPVIIHSAVPGGIERFIYMMLDNFPQSFPLWLYPVQVRFLSVSKKYVYFCQDLIHKYQNLPIRFEIDDRNESVSKKIKLAHEDLVPFYAVIGEREIKGNFKELDLIVEKIVQESKDKPFIGLNYSQLISKQIN